MILNEILDFQNLTSSEVTTLLKKHQIALSIDEALIIQNQLLQRPPTLTECILWSIQCSEHCSYKSTRQYLKLLPITSDDVILGPKEDAGIVSLACDHQGLRYGIVVSHESHNHPSQIVPFEGAATGVGGNVRDVCCMGAEVIAIADNLRFGDIKTNKTKWLHEGVISGIASYGNCIGVPNLGGNLYYNSAYNDNCLVTVVTLGLVREDQIIHSYAPTNALGYDLILVGKATDNSGFAGASFASLELNEQAKDQNRGAVQEPNAFLGRHLLQANYALFKILQKEGLIDKVGFKDLGAGGIACASVELAEGGGYGATIELDRVPVNIINLHPAVILCSETQERYMWVVPPTITPMILEHYNQTFALPTIAEKSQATMIGKITDGNYIVSYQGCKLVNASPASICKGLSYDRPSVPNKLHHTEPTLASIYDYNQTLLNLLAHENIACRKPVFETYDKQVQGRTIIEAGQADAGVLQPFNSDDFPPEIQMVGVALGTAHNPRFGQIEAYQGAINAVVEAISNVTAVGAKPIAVTDCLCCGNPEKPKQMAELIETIKGIADSCKTLHLPVISGNVSLYNESSNGAIPPSPIIGCIGKLTASNLAITKSFKQPDSIIVMIGERFNELGGSCYYALHNQLGANLPRPDLTEFAKQLKTLQKATEQQLILAMHDISDGGIAVALAEMSFTNNLGLEINIAGDLTDTIKLFSESFGFVLEVATTNLANLEKIFQTQKVKYQIIGKTTTAPYLRMHNVINLELSIAKQAWLNGLREKLL